MYHAIRVEQLSKEQTNKLLRGLPVRVKHNPQGPLSLKLSVEQAKKVARAYKKKASCNISLDPYQIDEHQSLKGSGLFSDARAKAKTVARSGLSQAKAQAMQKAREQGKLAVQRGQKYILDEGLPQLDHRIRIGVKKIEKDHLRDDDREYYDAPFDDFDGDINGDGIGRFFKKVKKGLKPVVKLAKPIVNQAYKIVKPKLDLVINEGIRAGMDAAMGGSVKRGRGRPRKALGQGLYPAGY